MNLPTGLVCIVMVIGSDATGQLQASTCGGAGGLRLIFATVCNRREVLDKDREILAKVLATQPSNESTGNATYASKVDPIASSFLLLGVCRCGKGLARAPR